MKIRGVHGSDRVKFVSNPELTQPNRVCNFQTYYQLVKDSGWIGWVPSDSAIFK